MGLRSIRARATALSMGHRRLIGLLCGLLVIGLLVTASYSQRPGRWARAAPMPEERTEVAVAELAGKVYVVGGFGRGQALLEYDPVSDRWRERASLPRALHHTTAAAVSGRLYVVGGYADLHNGWNPVDTVFEYDPTTDQWRQRANMPTARGALAVGVIDGKIHAVGGVGGNRRNTGAHEVYDPATDRWIPLPPLPTPRDHLAAGVVGKRLYVIGGRLDGSYARNLQTNEEYDAGTNRWRERAPLPTARSGIAAAVLDGKIFVGGGEAPAGTFNQVEAYDPATDTWTTWAPMPTARHGLGAAAVGGRIFVISGGPRPGGSYSAVNEAFTP